MEQTYIRLNDGNEIPQMGLGVFTIPEARGKELDLSAVRAFRGRLEEFVVTRRPGGVPLCRS